MPEPPNYEFQYLDDSLAPHTAYAVRNKGWFVKEPSGTVQGPFEFLTYKGDDNQDWTMYLHYETVAGGQTELVGLWHKLKGSNQLDNNRPTFQVWDWNRKDIHMTYAGFTPWNAVVFNVI